MKYALLIFALIFSGMTFAAEVSTYQITGPVVEVRDDFIVIQKGDTKLEIARDLDTKGGFNLTAGDLVTVQFTMNAKLIIKD